MSKYYINKCHINNKTSFVMAILGCIASEGEKLYKPNRTPEETAKYKEYFESLRKLTFSISVILAAEEKPFDLFLSNPDVLKTCDISSCFIKLQEHADELSNQINEPIEIHFFGHFGRTDAECTDFLPDFHDKVKLEFD